MKIIRISGCHDCPLRAYLQDPADPSKGITECYSDDTPETVVTEHERNKTLPDNCPLDDEK